LTCCNIGYTPAKSRHVTDIDGLDTTYVVGAMQEDKRGSWLDAYDEPQ